MPTVRKIRASGAGLHACSSVLSRSFVLKNRVGEKAVPTPSRYDDQPADFFFFL